MVDYCGEEVVEEDRISGGWAHMLLGSVQECSLFVVVVAVAAVGAGLDSEQVLEVEEVAEADR